MNKEARRWLRQAQADLKAAKDSMNSNNHEWSCFQSQQASEKALKAYLYNLGYTSLMTHSLKILLDNCAKKQKYFLQLKDHARLLDTYYITTRYPNGIDEDIAPTDYYDKEDSEKCLKSATLILNAVRKYLPE